MTTFDIFQNNFKIILPEFFFINSILIILVFGTLYNASTYYKYPILTKSIGWLSIQTLLISLLLLLNGSFNAPSSVLIFNNVLIMDDFALFIKTIVLIGALSTILISFKYTYNQKMSARINEYMVLILFSTLSMLLIISSFDLISMYLAIELQSLAFYVLAAFQRNNEFSTESGLKYFILGALASGLLLFGESLIYGFTGLTNFEELSKLFTIITISENTLNTNELGTVLQVSSLNIPFLNGFEIFPLFQGNKVLNFTYVDIINIGLLFILIAFLFKISAVPFHLWTPDVYEGAPTSVTAFFAITPKIAIIALLLRLCMYTFYDFIDSWQSLIIFCSILSMFIGTLGAIHQNKIKRLFAYSSIAHVGYILIGLATGTIESIEALLIYSVLYVITIINIFGIILVMARENFSIQKHDFSTLLPAPNAGAFKPSVLLSQKSIKFKPSVFYLENLKKNIQQDSSNLILNTDTLKKKNNLPNRLTFTSSTLINNLQFVSKTTKSENYLSLLVKGNPIWNPFNFSKYLQEFNDKNQSSFHQYNIKTSLWDNAHFSWNLLKNDNTASRANNNSSFKNTSNINYIKHITDFASLSKTNPILAFTAAIIFFSNAGIPPLAGFYGKLNVFLTAIENSMYLLALVGILCSVLGCFYSIRLVKIIYYHSMSNTTWPLYQPISKENAFILAITFFFTLFFFLTPSFLFLSAHTAALSLCI